MTNPEEPSYLSWTPSKPEPDAEPDPETGSFPSESAEEPRQVVEPTPAMEAEPVVEAERDVESEQRVAAPADYEAPTTDRSGFIDAHGFYKQPRPQGELSFDVAALSGEQRRLLSYRLTELNVDHRVEGTTVVAGMDAATAVQGQIDDILAPTEPEEEVAEWMHPAPLQPESVVDEPIVARSEPEEIVVPASTDVEEVIEESDEDEDEIVFDLASLSTEERRHLTMRLTGAGIAHIWEVATDLVVSVKDASMIESYIGEVQNPDGFGDDELVAFESGDDVDDEQVYAAMSNLYVAADRLMQRPNDPSSRTAFYDATDDVDGLPAPFGFDPRVWTQVLNLANTIADAMDAEVDEDAVATDARALRQLLVNYV